MTEETLFATKIERGVFVVIMSADVTKSSDSFLMAQTDVLCRNFHNSGCVAVVVNCGEVQYFNSIILESLLNLWTAQGQRAGLMAVCNLSEFGREVLAVAQIEQVWKQFEGEEEAINSVCEVIATQSL